MAETCVDDLNMRASEKKKNKILSKETKKQNSYPIIIQTPAQESYQGGGGIIKSNFFDNLNIECPEIQLNLGFGGHPPPCILSWLNEMVTSHQP